MLGKSLSRPSRFLGYVEDCEDITKQYFELDAVRFKYSIQYHYESRC